MYPHKNHEPQYERESIKLKSVFPPLACYVAKLRSKPTIYHLISSLMTDCRIYSCVDTHKLFVCVLFDRKKKYIAAYIYIQHAYFSLDHWFR